MSRRTSSARREILPDPKFGEVKLTKFINMLLRDGNKATAEGLAYGALDQIRSRRGSDPVETMELALSNVSPAVEVKSRRVGGATYQVPVEVRPVRRNALAMRWIIDAAKRRSDKTMTSKLANELMDAADKRGSAFKKREDTHRMADANKAFAHYRW
jgi:small subunit ribosomal protein S7